MLSSVEQAFVGREEIRAPLKTPAWEARTAGALNEIIVIIIKFKSLVPGHVNRCLIIPEASIKANSKYKSLSVLVTLLINSAYPKTHTNMVLSVKTC